MLIGTSRGACAIGDKSETHRISMRAVRQQRGGSLKIHAGENDWEEQSTAS